MKDYISLLTNEDLMFICQTIGGKPLKELYKKNTRSFNKIRPGFRPDGLSGDQLFDFAVRNKNAGFVSSFINGWIDDRLIEIEAYKNDQLAEGSENLAIARTLPFSVFEAHPDLYFTLTETQLPTADRQIFYKLMEVIRVNKRLAQKVDENSITSEQDKSVMQTLQDEFESKIEQMQKAHEKELTDSRAETTILEETVSRMTDELSVKTDEISALQKELEGYKELEKYRISWPRIIPAEDYFCTSLCRVYSDDYGNSRLLRLGDVRAGEVTDTFCADAPNYKNLYRKDGPSREGFIGIWDWKTVPNNNDPERDYIITAYNSSAEVIELIQVQDYHSITELIEALKGGLTISYHTNTVILSVYNGESFEGVHCDSSFMNMQTTSISLKSNVMKLPVYRISMGEVLHFDGISIINMSAIGIPTCFARVKDPLQVVQNLIISRASWPVMQQNGFIRNEYRQIKEFLTKLPTDDMFDEICRSCGCSLEEAKEYVASFIKRFEECAFGVTLENGVMAQIIRNDKVLYTSCMDELTTDWEKQNQEKLDTAHSALFAAQDEERACKEECAKQRELLDSFEQQLQGIRDEIAAEEKLAQDVQTCVLGKIEQARNNAAEFIAENAFIHVNSTTREESKAVAVAAVQQIDNTFSPSEALETTEAEENDDYTQLLQTIQSELLEAGVKETFVVSLSAFLYSAYLNHIPVLLAGPNGLDIAKAFSVSLNCRLPAVLKCCGDFNLQSIHASETAPDKIVVIEQPFQNGWENNVIALLSKRDRFYVLVHPFAEDVVIEPRGLFNYCVPMLTEMFVDSVPSGEYIGGSLTTRFEHYKPDKTTRSYEKLLSSMRVSTIAGSNIQRLISDENALLGVHNADADYGILLYSIAYVLGELDVFSTWLDKADPKPTSALKGFLKNLIGDNE